MSVVVAANEDSSMLKDNVNHNKDVEDESAINNGFNDQKFNQKFV